MAQVWSRAFLAAATVILLGYVAGMQLNKIAPLVTRIEAEWGLSLTFTGWLASLLGLFVALAAFPATLLAKRFGLRRALMAASVILTLGAVGFGLFSTPALLLVMRAVEAAGYVVLCVAAPAFLAIHAPVQQKGMFLALWGSFVPVGYSAAVLWVDILPENWPIETLFLTFAIPMAVMTVALPVLPPDGPLRQTGTKRPTVAIPAAGWLLTIAFGLYVYLSLAFFMFLPKFLESGEVTGGLSPAVVSLAVPAGNFAAAFLLAAFGSARAVIVASAGFLMVFATGISLFQFGTLPGPSMLVHAFGGGLAASCIFAAVPLVADDEAGAAVTVGTIAQSGGIMTVIAAPFAGYLIETLSWQAWGWSLIIVAGLALLSCLAMRKPG